MNKHLPWFEVLLQNFPGGTQNKHKEPVMIEWNSSMTE